MSVLKTINLTKPLLCRKAAVKNGIIEAKQILGEIDLPKKLDDGTQIA